MSLHQHLLEIVKKLPTDFEPYGQRDRDAEWGPDCSCGCRHFVPLEGTLGNDWGICANPASPRCALLTFEHQGCPQFEGEVEELPAPANMEPEPLAVAHEESQSQALPEPAGAARKKVKVELDAFILALEGFPSGEIRYVLDTETGEVVPLIEEADDYEECCEKIEASEFGRSHHIEPLDSHESFRVMEDFAASLPESEMTRALCDALSRNKPFRRFKDIVHGDLTLRERWFAFREDALAELARDALAVEGIDVAWIRR